MAMVAIGGALIGAVFGLRFKVLVLLPAILVGTLTLAVVGIALGSAISTIVINIIAWACALQSGYLVGLFTQFVMVEARARRTAQPTSLVRAPH